MKICFYLGLFGLKLVQSLLYRNQKLKYTLTKTLQGPFENPLATLDISNWIRLFTWSTCGAWWDPSWVWPHPLTLHILPVTSNPPDASFMSIIGWLSRYSSLSSSGATLKSATSPSLFPLKYKSKSIGSKTSRRRKILILEHFDGDRFNRLVVKRDFKFLYVFSNVSNKLEKLLYNPVVKNWLIFKNRKLLSKVLVLVVVEAGDSCPICLGFKTVI